MVGEGEGKGHQGPSIASCFIKNRAISIKPSPAYQSYKYRLRRPLLVCFHFAFTLLSLCSHPLDLVMTQVTNVLLPVSGAAHSPMRALELMGQIQLEVEAMVAAEAEAAQLEIVEMLSDATSADAPGFTTRAEHLALQQEVGEHSNTAHQHNTAQQHISTTQQHSRARLTHLVVWLSVYLPVLPLYVRACHRHCQGIRVLVIDKHSHLTNMDATLTIYHNRYATNAF